MAPQGDGGVTELELPKQFTKASDILNGEARTNSLVNVIGVIRDYRPPMLCRSQDYKSTISFFDKSTEHEGGATVTINVFQKKEYMPEINAGDVIIIYSTKIQDWGGPSLLSNHGTAAFIYAASRIPKPPANAEPAMSPAFAGKNARLKPADTEHAYVSWLYHNVERWLIPAPDEFRVQVERAMVSTDKFKLFKDLKDHMFCNAIVQVIMKPWVEGDRATLWVTDYTSNEAFKRFTHEARPDSDPSDGDPYGYIKTSQQDWPGPYGQRAMQVSAWGYHATAIGANVRQKSWLMLRNLQIKFGSNGLYLEGFLREERNSFDRKLGVEVLETNEAADSRLREALQRGLHCEKMKRKQSREQGIDTASQPVTSQKKHSHEQPQGESRKQKRQKMYAKVQQQEAEKQAAEKKRLEEEKEGQAKQQQAEASMRLNKSVKCQSIDRPATSLATLLKPLTRNMGVEGEQILVTLPFVNSKHRVIVRVVDFVPKNLQDFAHWRQMSEFDILSDYSGIDSDSDVDMNTGDLEAYRGEKKWEWRFALQLEEVNLDSGENESSRLWAVVDNIEGQQLTNLNACDLRANEEQFSQLKEQMFRLWGNLEEIKSVKAQNNIARRRRINAGKPPDSSPARAHSGDDETKTGSPKLSNTPFSCCIRQYGVTVEENDPTKADAGPERRWQRLFGIFGTRIVSGVTE